MKCPTKSAIGSLGMRICGTVHKTVRVSSRFQSTSTMDLVSEDETWYSAAPSSIRSTLQFKAPGRDVSSSMLTSTPFETAVFAERWGTFDDSATASSTYPVDRTVESDELDLIQASQRLDMYDKIFLIVHHGEEEAQNPGTMQEDSTDALTGRGVGQSLSLSRRTATFCNGETGLSPELVLVPPIRSALQTMFLTFPYDTPYQSIHHTRWICYPTVHRSTATLLPLIADLQREFAGIDCSICRDEDALIQSSYERLRKEASGMLDWLKTRKEKVVVGKFIFIHRCDITLSAHCTVTQTDASSCLLQSVALHLGLRPLGRNWSTTELQRYSATAK